MRWWLSSDVQASAWTWIRRPIRMAALPARTTPTETRSSSGSRSRDARLVGLTVFVHEAAVGVGAHQVNVRARGDVGGRARADFEIDRHRARLVDHVMAVAGSFRKRRTIAGAQNRLARVFDQRQLALEHIDEFVFVRMPVALARPIPRRQMHEIDAEILEASGIAEPLAHAFGARRVELRRIARASAFRHRGDVDLRHGGISLTD